MTIFKKRLSLMVGLVAVFAMGLATWATASSVSPIHLTGASNTDKTCEYLDGLYADEGTTWIEYKLEPVGDGTYTVGDGYLSVDIVKPSIEAGSVNSFDWKSNIGVDAVVVKNGTDGANLYVYDPMEESFGDTYLTTPFDGAKAISHISFCYDVELGVDKDANTSLTRTYDWDITKEADATYDLFRGDTQDHEYTVSVEKDDGTDSDWVVTGSIYIDNNTPFDATIASVTDAISGYGDVAVVCPEDFPYTLLAGESLTCTYGADLPDATTRTNTATVTTTDSSLVAGDDATADVDFATATITEVNDTVTVTDTNAAFGGDKTVGDDTTFPSYEVEFACDADEGEHVNKAQVIGDGDVVLDEDTATVKVNCYELTVTKDAVVETYTQEYNWEITKNPNGDYDLFSGDEVVHKYTIDVIRGSLAAESAVVKGDITVSNASPIDAVITDVADVVTGAGLTDVGATVDCGGAFPITIAAGGTLECTYEATVDDSGYDLNTATATLQNYDYAFDGSATAGGTTEFSGTADVVFAGVTPEILPVSVVDDYATADTGDDIEFGPFTDTGSVSYERTFACDDDEGTHTNTATLFDSDGNAIGSDTATVTLACYDLTVTKDAGGTYDERHTWEIEKSVDPESQSGYPGDLLGWTWTVSVSESFVDENFALTGDITVSNEGNPIPAEIVGVADVVSGTGLDPVVASVDCGGAFPIVIPADDTLECTYVAGTDDLREYETNTATATLQNYRYYGEGFDPTPAPVENGTTDFTGTAAVTYTKTVMNGTAVVTDDQGPLVEALTAGEGPWEFEYSASDTCSSSYGDYGEDGTYSVTLDNTAVVTGSDGQTDSADASTSYTCEAGTVDVLKYTDGLVNPEKDWQFALYVGPDGFGGTQVGSTSSTLGDGDGVLDFGMPALRPDTTYTVCELDVPAGWTSYWQVDVDGDGILDAAVVPYNPDSDNDPPDDLGNRCVDFGDGTTIPVTVGTTIRFEVDNTFPGGDPRTPGYWKNWNRCTGGGQADNADKNGGYLEGYWLLEDVLDPNIGGGIVWDDILTDSFRYPITGCAQAVDILDKREVGDPAIVGDGKKAASDPLVNLATHLLAAQLNFGAGACTTQGVLDAALQAETLLDSYNFDGRAGLIPKKDKVDGPLANSLASYLDDYNNGEFCGSTNGG